MFIQTMDQMTRHVKGVADGKPPFSAAPRTSALQSW